MQNLKSLTKKIRVLIPKQKEFKIIEPELKALYIKKQKNICDTNSFEFIRDNTFLYTFLIADNLIGCIYYFLDNDNRLFLNAFSKRKTFQLNIICLTLSLSWFNCPIYAEAQNRASALCLLRCGFKRKKNNLFIYDTS